MIQNSKSRREYKLIPTDLIEPSDTREVYEDLDSLAETIKRHGLLHPILVKEKSDNRFEVVVGDRRLKACQLLAMNEIPCIVADGLTEEEILQMRIIENIQRNDLKVHEQIKLVQTLRDKFNLNYDEISVQTGLSEGTVQNYLTIAEGLPEKFIRQISHGSHDPTDLTTTKAMILARAELPPDKLKETVDVITRKGLSTTQLSRRLAERSSRKKIKRVLRDSRTYWKQLTRTLHDFARYWSDYTELKEWETVSHYHLQLNVSLPKDLEEGDD